MPYSRLLISIFILTRPFLVSGNGFQLAYTQGFERTGGSYANCGTIQAPNLQPFCDLVINKFDSMGGLRRLEAIHFSAPVHTKGKLIAENTNFATSIVKLIGSAAGYRIWTEWEQIDYANNHSQNQTFDPLPTQGDHNTDFQMGNYIHSPGSPVIGWYLLSTFDGLTDFFGPSSHTFDGQPDYNLFQGLLTRPKTLIEATFGLSNSSPTMIWKYQRAYWHNLGTYRNYYYWHNHQPISVDDSYLESGTQETPGNPSNPIMLYYEYSCLPPLSCCVLAHEEI